ncbi:CpeT/CpcT family (DUF1001) [Synechococcus sp. PCC 7502]|uniref:chromophore lyase CpcT/CpeT n=1 Tax=Synechococcus sp. PCC 7502 TaxID=1173263 RepID=UPI00029F8287|nr:chromophore lyase CpcT/CpeT [Synechococcus sp. PCC 7502]AFY74490.1 CpeT/CpcT family (DUF1001) [Synechococcus sp. PCC 7502]
MASQTDLINLATWMAGDFSNWEQAIENPPFFAHIRVGIRPLPVPLSDQGIWLYSEQAYDYEINRPYRTAILQLLLTDISEYPIAINNYKINNASTYYGASREPERLRSLTFEDIELQIGCKMLVQITPDNAFKGEVEQGKGCKVVRNGQETYLSSEFEISASHFSSLDRGYDPISNERVWGSIAGAFEFTKKVQFPL